MFSVGIRLKGGDNSVSLHIDIFSIKKYFFADNEFSAAVMLMLYSSAWRILGH